jgi:hypothetical protein
MYTANLAAFNTVSRLTVSVSSMDELAAQTEIKYSTLEESSMQTYFKVRMTVNAKTWGRLFKAR